MMKIVLCCFGLLFPILSKAALVEYYCEYQSKEKQQMTLNIKYFEGSGYAEVFHHGSNAPCVKAGFCEPDVYAISNLPSTILFKYKSDGILRAVDIKVHRSSLNFSYREEIGDFIIRNAGKCR